MKHIAVLSLALLTACQPITNYYEPIIDEKKVDLNKYAQDLKECREYGQKVHDDTIAAGIVMALAGAGLGAAIGNQYNMASQGAHYGAIAGAASGSLHAQNNYQQGYMGVIDNCLSGRGYKILGRK